MTDDGSAQQIDFTVNKDNLYREESITDLKVASIRYMKPIKTDGSDDSDRKPVFMAHTQVMSPEGPLPIQAPLSATTLEEALDEFPSAMQKALTEVINRIQKLQQQQQQQQEDDSRIIVPGR
jgi:hypothetical protein